MFVDCFSIVIDDVSVVVTDDKLRIYLEIPDLFCELVGVSPEVIAIAECNVLASYVFVEIESYSLGWREKAPWLNNWEYFF